MQSSSTVIFMLHNFNPSPNTLMHHVVRKPCHTGYLNTVQHTDLDFFCLPTTNISTWNRFNWCTVWSRGTTSNWHNINFDSLLSPMKTPTMCGIWFPHRRAMHAVVATPGQSEEEETTPTTWNRWPCWAVTTRQASVWRIWGLVCESSCVVLVVLNYWFLICVFMFECNDFHDRNNDPCLDVGSIDDNRSFHTDGNAGRWVEWSFEHGSDIEAHPQSTLSCLGGGRRAHREWPRESQDTMERGR